MDRPFQIYKMNYNRISTFLFLVVKKVIKITLITMGNVVQNDGVEAYSMNVPLQETFYCAKETKKYEHVYTVHMYVHMY